MSARRILVVDDEPQLRRVMRTALSAEGCDVSGARSGEEALQQLGSEAFDVILLDMNMPGIGGIAACRALRSAWDVPIIMLTVRGAEKDKVKALDAVADDYVTKPFSTPELLARIRAAMRRTSGNPVPQRLALENMEIDFHAHQVIAGDKQVRLTPTEFELLRYLAMRPNRAVAHHELLQAVWGREYRDDVQYLRVFVNQLRKKIEPDTSSPRYLLTEPWFGYRFKLPER